MYIQIRKKAKEFTRKGQKVTEFSDSRKAQNRKRENQLVYTRKNEKIRDVYHECITIQRKELSLSYLFNTALHHHVLTVISREAHLIEVYSNILHVSLCMLI
jgi:hypothetical protein